MKEITVLTTFHQSGLDQYGQRFLDSFAKNIDKKVKLLVYAENCQPNNPDPEQITILDAVEALPKLVAFKHKDFWQCVDTIRDKKNLESAIKYKKLKKLFD